MSTADRLAEIERQVRTFSALGHPHDGDCAGSLCASCGHCLHSVDDCSCPDCGCFDDVADDAKLMRRAALALIAALRAVLDLHKSSLDTRNVGAYIDGEWTPYCEECGDPYPCAEVRAIESALGGAE